MFVKVEHNHHVGEVGEPGQGFGTKPTCIKHEARTVWPPIVLLGRNATAFNNADWDIGDLLNSALYPKLT